MTQVVPISAARSLVRAQDGRLSGKRWHDQHGAPTKRLFAAQDVAIYMVSHIQHLHPHTSHVLIQQNGLPNVPGSELVCREPGHMGHGIARHSTAQQSTAQHSTAQHSEKVSEAWVGAG